MVETQLEFTKGQKVLFAEEPTRLWTVRAVGERFAVLTRPMNASDAIEFDMSSHEGECMYTIVDTELGIRGRHNLVLNGFDFKSQRGCTRCLQALEAPEGSQHRIELSSRDRVPVEILPPRKQTNMITIRLTASEHKKLIADAKAAKLSLNTHCLMMLGFTVPDDGAKPRGRKAK